jgi:ribonuclease H2 subunit A
MDNEESQVSLHEVDVELSKGFIPPSVSQRSSLSKHSSESYTYHSPLPQTLLDTPDEPCILGVDEAGRGPVLGAILLIPTNSGPMVYAVAYCPISYKETLQTLSFADSKVLTPQVRSDLLEQLCSPSSDHLFASVGWSTRVMTATDISADMLSPTPYNLNAQAHDTTIALIRQVISMGVNVREIYVDTVGPEVSYQEKLAGHFPGAIVTVTKKADSKFPIVSAASVCAKVTRDVVLGNEEVWGSGYPSDPRTSRWLKGDGMDKVFGWDTEEVRYSWSTARELLEKNKDAVKVNW